VTLAELPRQGPGSAQGGVVDRSDVEWRRRVMIFGDSIRSDFENPLATTWRALMRSLTRSGHEVVFIEPRRSESLTRLLRHRGSAPLRQFSEVYPDLQYRTFDLPHGRELSIWLARELALVDCVVVLDNATEKLKAFIMAHDEPRLLRVQPSGTDQFMTSIGKPLLLGPAIDLPRSQPRVLMPADMLRVAVLAWDAELASLATQAWHRVATINPKVRRFSLGSLSLDGWVPITELDLASVLAEIDIAVVIAGLHPAGPAMAVRSLLPLSFGVQSVTIVANLHEPRNHLPVPVVVLDGIARSIAELTQASWPDMSPWSADTQASALIAAIDQSQAVLRADRA